ncbi:MAG: hypothetical protein AABN95_14660 [Acidobacteriota bacterium]
MARGQADTNDRPYKMFYQYDAIDNLVGRMGSATWSAPAFAFQNTSTFSNNRNTSWQYDADGRLTSGDGIQHTHDAAGRVITAVSNSGNQTQTRIFDGDGQATKTVESATENDGFGSMVTTITTRYSVVSSVVGAAITDLNETGQKTRTLVYSGGQVLAWQGKSLGSESVMWEYRDPTDASYRMFPDTSSDGPRVGEMDPLGANAGGHNPLSTPQQHWPREDLTYPAFADLISGNCAIDRIPAPCAMRNRLMDSGSLTMETGVTINGRGGPVKEPRDIISYGLGIYGIWLHDGARGNDGQYDLHLSTLPQNYGPVTQTQIQIANNAVDRRYDYCKKKHFGNSDVLGTRHIPDQNAAVMSLAAGMNNPDNAARVAGIFSQESDFSLNPKKWGGEAGPGQLSGAVLKYWPWALVGDAFGTRLVTNSKGQLAINNRGQWDGNSWDNMATMRNIVMSYNSDYNAAYAYGPGPTKAVRDRYAQEVTARTPTYKAFFNCLLGKE